MLRLAEEILLLALDEEQGDLAAAYSPRRLDVVVAAAVLMDLALEGRIDTDPEQLVLADPAPTGDDLLDPILAEIVAGPTGRDADFWLERAARSGGAIRDRIISRLVEQGVLETRAGGIFLSRIVSRSRRYPTRDGRPVGEVRLRLLRELFSDEIPDPRDGLLICLSDAAGLLDRLITADEKAELEDRIDLIRRLELLGRSMFAAVKQMREREAAVAARPDREIPEADGLPLLGNALSLIGDPNPFLARQHQKLGPIFRIRAAHRSFVVLAGPEAGQFLNRQSRAHFRSIDAWRFVGWRLGTTKLLAALDGPVHVGMRKLVAPGFSVQRIRERLRDFLFVTRLESDTWADQGTIRALSAVQRVTARQAVVSFTGISSSDWFDDPRAIADLDALFEAAVTSNLVGPLPRLWLKRRAAARGRRRMVALYEEIVAAREAEEDRPGPRDYVDDLLAMHRTDPQLITEEDLPFHVASGVFANLHTSAVVVVLALYEALKRPELLQRMTAEADALFASGTPEVPTLAQIDVTHRFLMETLRVHPITTGILRRVANSFSFAGYSVPAGTDVLVAVAATHRLQEHFREPERFDIERFAPDRAEHRAPGVYAPFGAGTHGCLGKGFAEMQMALTLAVLLHDLELEPASPGRGLKLTYRPGTRPSDSLRFRVRRRNREARASGG